MALCDRTRHGLVRIELEFRMRIQLRALVLIIATTISGCDSAFLKQIDVDRPSSEIITVNSAFDDQVIEIIRSYAKEHDLECQNPEGGFLIRCAKIPMQVFAFRTSGGVTVCYASGGIPTEWAKNNALARQLETYLSQRFGEKKVFSSPMSGAWTERCRDGIISNGMKSGEK